MKIGGSLLADTPRLRALLTALADGAEGPVVIVPGGGPFAEAVRASQAVLGYSDALAHRLAIDAMGRMAEVFSEIEPRLSVSRSAEAAAAHAGSCLWDPAALRSGHPDIPESWDVTSDSLALWLATALGAERCVLLKSAPCLVDATPNELARLGLVDRAFPMFARSFAGEIVLRGPDATSNPHPHPEVRSAAEPRRTAPESSAIPGALFRGLGYAAAPQDAGVGGMSLAAAWEAGP